MPNEKREASGTSLFQTKDINLAAYLKCKGYHILRLLRQNGRVVFCFDDTNRKQREEDVQAFYNDVGGFLSYANAWKDFKSMVHNVRIEHGED